MLRQLGEEPLPLDQAHLFSRYLLLLLRWNDKINLTAIRNGEDILKRHFLESILCARLLPKEVRTLLDYGSGAGFPGIPCAICCPEVQVTLAESQTKKAAFLREVTRSLCLNTTVYHGRVETLSSAIKYDAVALRAVDHMADACVEALTHVRSGGWMAVMTTQDTVRGLVAKLPGVAWTSPLALCGTAQQVLLLGRTPATEVFHVEHS